MKKKNRPVQQAANADIRMSDVTSITDRIQAYKRPPEKNRARVCMLRTGAEGWTENAILRYCRLSPGRNYASEPERRPDIYPKRIDAKNPDGIDAHPRYRFALRGDVLRGIKPVNHNAAINEHCGVSLQGIADILNLYRDAFNAA